MVFRTNIEIIAGMTNTISIGSLLKKWRKQRRYSQLQLSLELDISSKHISFIETGRSLPSKEMILKICTFLGLTKREVNRLLNIAGYAPAYAALSLSDKELKPVLEAINQIIENHSPYPALVIDRNWDIVNANNSANKLMTNLGFSAYTNLIEAIISDQPRQGHISKIINWYEASSLVLMRLREEINLLGEPKRLQALAEKLNECLSSDEKSLYDEITHKDTQKTVLSTRFKVNGEVLSFFSIIAQLGTVQDVTLSEFKVELMFPTDNATKNYYQ